MDESLTYAIFGCSFCVFGNVIVFLWYHNLWRRSKQKARSEYVKFWSHLESIGIDYKIIMEVAAQMKCMEDFESANRRLKKVSHESQLQHK